MKKLKQSVLLSCFVAYVAIGSAQPAFTIELAQLLPSFKFKDSEGVQHNNEYQSLVTGAYGLGFRYVSEGGIILKSAIGMRNGGANLVYDDTNYSWKLQYADIKLGVGYMANFKTIKPHIIVSGYYATLLRGIQTTHDDQINIVKSSVLKNNDFGLVFAPGIDIKLSRYVSSFIEFNYLMGLANIELGSTQKTKNSAFGISIGIATSFIER